MPLLLMLVLALLAGCGASEEDPAATATPEGAAAFPATVEHKFGTTTVPEEPERIVVVGLTEQVSRLAPTVAAGKGSTDYFSPWDQQVELVAAALGKPQEGRELVRSIEDSYAEAAAANAEFEGRTATFSQNAFYDGLICVYPDGLSTDFLTMLGFTINPKLTPLVEREGEQVGISAERLGVLEADVIVFATEKPSDVANLKESRPSTSSRRWPRTARCTRTACWRARCTSSAR